MIIEKTTEYQVIFKRGLVGSRQTLKEAKELASKMRKGDERWQIYKRTETVSLTADSIHEDKK